jgi:hypothetical protein
MPPGQNWPKRKPGRIFSRRHRVEVRFGEPIRPREGEHRREVMARVREFWDRKGLAPDPEPVPAPDASPEPALRSVPGRFERSGEPHAAPGRSTTAA